MPRKGTDPSASKISATSDGFAEALAHKGGLLLSMPRSILSLSRYRRMFLFPQPKATPLVSCQQVWRPKMDEVIKTMEHNVRLV
jgi:hypothetical protein